ncbi:SDR family oxidoreductase [Nocardioides sp.]|uniref:SDR family oxidoreductase n=1 Tax=Nocardioides sp. TaxID=35761 RepID=UPI003517296D
MTATPTAPTPDTDDSGQLIGVTGATGAIGGRVAGLLADAGRRQRLLVRDAGRAPEIGGAEVAECAYRDRASSERALQGVTTLLMVSAAEAADRLEEHRTFLDAAAAAGVRHVVYTSFYGASPTCTFTLGRDHWATEQHALALHERTGLGFTFLRDNLYLDFLPGLVGEDGVIRGPAGEGRMSGVARDDVAAAAAAVLLDPDRHRGATYDLTGPEELGLDDVARIVGARLGREVSYHRESVEEAYASRRRWPAPPWQYDAWVSTYTAIAAGEMAGVSDHVAHLTGRPATDLATLLEREA